MIVKIIPIVSVKLQPTRSVCLVSEDGTQVLFECCECTQHEIQFSSHISLSRLSTIFISSLHCPRLYGLIGLLLTRMGAIPNASSLTIVGPSGIKNAVLTVLDLSGDERNTTESLHFIELDVSTPTTDLGTSLLGDAKTRVIALASNTHSGFSFAVIEADRRGTFMPHQAIARGLTDVSKFKILCRGDDVILDDNTVVKSKDVVGAPHAGAVFMLVLHDRLQQSALDNAFVTRLQEVCMNRDVKVLDFVAR